MNRTVSATLVYAFAAGLTMLLLRYWNPDLLQWTEPQKPVLWTVVAAYSLFLARWSKTPFTALFFPLAMLAVSALQPGDPAGFCMVALITLSWIRSGVCFGGPVLRRFAAEAVTAAGGGVLVSLLVPAGSPFAAQILGMVFFLLVQALYFFIITGDSEWRERKNDTDPFERALGGAYRILDAESSEEV